MLEWAIEQQLAAALHEHSQSLGSRKAGQCQAGSYFGHVWFCYGMARCRYRADTIDQLMSAAISLRPRSAHIT